jgi:OOP family OmpA-OmpF porin
MRRITPLIGLGCALALLGACTTALPPDKTPALGGSFNEALKTGYVQLAESLKSQGDIELFHFRAKAKEAMIGDVVWPDRVDSRVIPTEVRDEALARRGQLIDLLEFGARSQAPLQAAKAQVAFDCWLAELDGGDTATDSSCHATLLEALAETQSALVDPAAIYAVYFDAGREQPEGPQRNVVTEAARAATVLRPARIDVVGYSDPSGSRADNEALSLARAEAVADGLVKSGVSPDLLDVRGAGASGDGDASQQRRVDISFDG